MNFETFLPGYGKCCPKCRSEKITSTNTTPILHVCLGCGKQFSHAQAAVSTTHKGER